LINLLILQSTEKVRPSAWASDRSGQYLCFSMPRR